MLGALEPGGGECRGGELLTCPAAPPLRKGGRRLFLAATFGEGLCSLYMLCDLCAFLLTDRVDDKAWF